MSKEIGFPEIGRRLHSIRGEMDQRGFSRRVNLSQQAVSNYERGNLPTSWAFLRRMNEDFNINLNWLFTGRGQRDYQGGTPYASLTDNRPHDWARSFLDQVAFADTDVLDLVLSIYFLYLTTEPADAKARMMADFQAIVEAVRLGGEESSPAEGPDPLEPVYDALARDDRRSVLQALIEAGEQREKGERGKAMPRARKAYLSAFTLARLQGWRQEEVEAARRTARTFRKEGRWNDAEHFFRLALATFDSSNGDGDGGGADGSSTAGGISAASRARTLLGYGQVAKHQGQIQVARERYLAALPWALKSQDPALRAEIYLDLACLAYHEGDWQKSLDFMGSGRAFAQQAGDRRLLNHFKLNEAVVLRERGDLDTAEAILRVLLAEGDAAEDLSICALASANLAEVLIDRGATEEAAEMLRKTATMAEEYGNLRNLALRKLLQARIEAARGEEGTARALLVDCLRYASDHGLKGEFEQAAAAITSTEGALQVQSAAKAS